MVLGLWGDWFRVWDWLWGCYDEFVEYGECGLWGVLNYVGFWEVIVVVVVVIVVWVSGFYGYCCYCVFCCMKFFYELVIVMVSVYVFLRNGGVC